MKTPALKNVKLKHEFSVSQWTYIIADRCLNGFITTDCKTNCFTTENMLWLDYSTILFYSQEEYFDFFELSFYKCNIIL